MIVLFIFSILVNATFLCELFGGSFDVGMGPFPQNDILEALSAVEETVGIRLRERKGKERRIEETYLHYFYSKTNTFSDTSSVIGFY